MSWGVSREAEPCILRAGIARFDDGGGIAEWALTFAEEGRRGFGWIGQSELVEAIFVDSVAAWETTVNDSGGDEDGA